MVVRRVHTKHVVVGVPGEIMEWSGHREEVLSKIYELDELISSILTGRTEAWRR